MLRRLLPAAADGLSRGGGAWMPPTATACSDQQLDRAEALRRMTVEYREHMHANVPVHEWELP